MNKTKSNNNISRHYELKISTVTQDSLDFINYVTKNKLYKFRRGKYILRQGIVFAVLFVISVATSVFMYQVGISDVLRLIFMIAAGIAIVRLFVALKAPFPKISEEQAIDAVIGTTSPFFMENERNSFYNLGEKGFSTDAYDRDGVLFFEYGVFKKAIECELGIILILNEEHIYCIPARYFNDDSACFIVEKLRQELKKKFITTGKMKIAD